MSRTDPPADPPAAAAKTAHARPVAQADGARPDAQKHSGKLAKPAAERRLVGIAVSAGVAIGPAFRSEEPAAIITRKAIDAGEVEGETSRLDVAITQSRKQLQKLRARLAVLPEDSQAEIAPLLDAYLQMIGPSRLVRGTKRRIAESLLSAEAAVADETESLARAIVALPIDATAGEDEAAARQRRAEEVREIGRRLIRNLTRAPFRNFAGLPEGAVLVCEGLRPADAALLDPSRLAGVATEEGGADGHTAIMLRALGVPAVLGVAGLHNPAQGTLVIVDGQAGTVVLNPEPATLANARKAVTAFARERQKLARLQRLPSVTLDGETIELQSNLEIPAELPLIAQSGATGIGLLRSEFLFMNRETLPDEAAQTETYRTVVEAMGGDPVTIRVLDWGGEKDIEALASEGVVPEAPDQNPALGLRGIRLLLRETALFETQLAAILHAATAGPVRVLLPMITTVAEVRAAREVYDRVARRLRRRGDRMPDKLPPLGIMIETPGAALAADALALEADFFAIGTNDLTMYTLAVDRGESDVMHLYDPLHPAVLRLVQFATEAALRMRMPVSVCGEMAANPKLTALLIGLGLRSFSMNASAVPRVKQMLRTLDTDDCIRFARRVMEQSDAARIREMVLGG
jgi:phosphotransferase system enzyme I (PtsI)